MDFKDSFIRFTDGKDCRIITDAPMSEQVSFKTGGNADILAFPYNAQCLAEIIKYAKENDIPITIIGNGSNLLISDNGIRGIVVKTAGALNKTECNDSIITADAGVSLSKVCTIALENKLSGAEFAYGIPGTIGGAVCMNAGAYGGEIRDILLDVTHITPDGKIETVEVQKLDLSYRHSFYSNNPDYIITSARFKLHKDSPAEIKTKMDDFISRRKLKQPLEYPSAGSTFKRPEGYFAGKLIEDCGLKGYKIGGAMVSEKHAGFVINYNHATTKDITELIKYIQKTVKEKTGVTLETEVKMIP